MHKHLYLAGLLILNGCAAVTPAPIRSLDPNTHGQVILVQGNLKRPQTARLSFWEFDSGGWQKIYGGIRAVVGRNGLAKAGEKREGDGRTPSGIYGLGPAFGYFPAVKTTLVYRQSGKNDFWVDDPASAQYNQWVEGSPQAQSFEKLRRDDHLYKLALVVQYNTDPVVPGAGSAIFVHIWRRYDHPTAGCVAMSERDLRRILRRLDQSDHPAIILQPHNGEE